MENRQLENEKKFKFTSELTIDEIRNLPKRQSTITCKVEKIDGFNEYKNVVLTVYLSDHCIVKLQQNYNSKAKIKPITDREFAYLKAILHKGENVNKLILSTPIRFVKGIDKNGHTYYRVVVFLASDLVKSIFLTKIDINMLDIDKFDDSLWETVEVSEEIEEESNDSIAGLFD